jgi:hypothetical protein
MEDTLFATENTAARGKKAREEMKKKIIVVDAFMTLLNLPTCSQYLIEVSFVAFYPNKICI